MSVPTPFLYYCSSRRKHFQFTHLIFLRNESVRITAWYMLFSNPVSNLSCNLINLEQNLQTSGGLGHQSQLHWCKIYVREIFVTKEEEKEKGETVQPRTGNESNVKITPDLASSSLPLSIPLSIHIQTFLLERDFILVHFYETACSTEYFSAKVWVSKVLGTAWPWTFFD